MIYSDSKVHYTYKDYINCDKKIIYTNLYYNITVLL